MMTNIKRFSYEDVTKTINVLRNEQQGNNWVYAPDLLKLLDERF